MGSLVPAGASEATLRAEMRPPVSEVVSAYLALMAIYLGKTVLFGHQHFGDEKENFNFGSTSPLKGNHWVFRADSLSTGS